MYGLPYSAKPYASWWANPSATGASTGSASVTEANDTLSATGSLTLRGSASVTEADDTLSATGSLTLRGSASITEADDTLSAAGGNTAASTGAGAVTEADDTLSAAGSLTLRGSLAVTGAGDTLGATGSLTLRGSLATTEADDTLASSGVLASASTGTLAVTEDSDTLSASNASASVAIGGAGRPSRRDVQLFHDFDRRLRKAAKRLKKKAVEVATPPEVEKAFEKVARLVTQIVATKATTVPTHTVLDDDFLKLLSTIDAAIQTNRITAARRQAQVAAEQAQRILDEDVARVRRRKQAQDDEDAVIALMMLL